MLIIRPRFFLSSDGRTVFDKRYGVVRFNSNDWSQKASSKLQNGWGLELIPIPALLTRMSRLPIDSSAFDMEEEPPSIQACYEFTPQRNLEMPMFKFPSMAIFASAFSYIFKNILEGDDDE